MNLTASSRLQPTQTHAGQGVWQPAKPLVIQAEDPSISVTSAQEVSHQFKMEILGRNSAFQREAEVHSPEVRLKIRFKNKMKKSRRKHWCLQTRQQRRGQKTRFEWAFENFCNFADDLQKVNNKIKKKEKSKNATSFGKPAKRGCSVWLKRVGKEAFYPFSKECPLLHVKYMKVL